MIKFPALKAGAIALAAVSLGFGVAACGSSTSKAAGIVPAPGEGATVAAVTTTTTASTVTTPSTGPLSKAPVIAKPTGAAPKSLVKKDLIVGTGATAVSGDELTVNYVGEVYSTGKVFQSSFTDGQGPLGPFQLGSGAVIPGWDQGLVGMKVGGRRELIIPPSLAYGSKGSNGIPANATLIFDVDLLAVSK